MELLTSAVARAFADPPEMVAGLLEGFGELARALGGMFNGVDDSVAGGILDQVLADPSGVAAGLAGRVGELADRQDIEGQSGSQRPAVERRTSNSRGRSAPGVGVLITNRSGQR